MNGFFLVALSGHLEILRIDERVFLIDVEKNNEI